jgi:uncharacterized protein with HEPN domain
LISDAAKNTPNEIQRLNKDIPWRKLAGFRDILCHGYFKLDDGTIWDAVANKIQPLKENAEDLLKYLDDNAN